MKIDKWFHLYSRKDDVVFEEENWLRQDATKPKIGGWLKSRICWGYECSECGLRIAVGENPKEHEFNFCYRCGAQMIGVVEDVD